MRSGLDRAGRGARSGAAARAGALADVRMRQGEHRAATMDARTCSFHVISRLSSVVHAVVMAAQALANPEHIGHLWGDVLAIFLIAAILAFLTPRNTSGETY